MNRRISSWLPALFLVVVVLLYFRKALFGGQMFFFADIATQNFPWKVFFADRLRNLSLPLWFPYMHSGFPLYAEIQAGTFYPPNWLAFFLLPPPLAYGLILALHLFLASGSTYLFCRELGLGRIPSLLGALVFSTGAFLVTHLVHLAMFLSACWLPLEFLLVERSLQRRNWTVLILSLGPVLALQILAGHPQIVAYSGLAVTLYLIAGLIREARRGQGRFEAKMIGGWAAALVLAVLLSAVQVLPTLELMGQSARAGGINLEFASEQSLPPWGLVTYLLPDFFGYATPQDAGDYWLFGINYWEMCPYVGILTLILGLLPLCCRPLGRWAFFYFLFGFSLILMLGRATPLFQALQSIPPFAYFRAPVRFSLLATLCLAILAARGLEILEKGNPAGPQVPRQKALTISIVTLFLTLAGLLSGSLTLRLWGKPIRAWLHAYGAHFVETNIHNKGLFLKPLEYYQNKLSGAVETILTRLQEALDPTEPRVFLCLALMTGALILLALLKRGRLPAGRFSLLCLLLLLADLLAFGLRYNRTVPVTEALSTPAVADFLKADPGPYRTFRDWRCRQLDIWGEKELLPVSLGSLWGISSADEFTPLKLKRYDETLSLIKRDRALVLRDEISYLNLLGLLNVKYLLSTLPLKGPQRLPPLNSKDGRAEDGSVQEWRQAAAETGSSFKLSEVHKNGEFRVYRNESVLPRCFLVTEVRVLDDTRSLLRVLSDPSFDFTRTVLLEEPPSGSSGPPPYPTPHPATLRPLAREAGRGPAPTLPPPTQASVLPLREEGDLLELEANADAQGFLVLAESWYPGWQAWVDDEPVKVYRADYVYQGVFLTAGPHKVRFQYLPTRLQTGALLSAAGLAIWIAGLALRRSSRRDRAG